MATASAQTLPTGGSVAAGSVVITQPSASSLTVTQSSQSAVVNWQSFSVSQGNSVTFAQPNASSAILNRVTSSATSTIAGQVNANGQVYLVNPNGIAITSTGTVNAGGGFVASTLGISDSDFMAGKRTFTGNGASAGVSNAGTISIGRGGYAALIGGTVSNSGSIDVPLGKVGLGSGERATLDFSGDGFLQVAAPTAAGGKGALIRNSGTIRADGGSVVISAATAREAARNAVNISGTVQARSIGGRSGSIVIGGGVGGRVRITGRLIATSRHSTGGSIQVTGKDIKLKGATVDASGKLGGGTINIGGGRQGQGFLQRAETVSIDKTTTIKADAKQTGNGGNVVVWSDLLTTFAGTISARGGALSGNGGEAEVSGKAQLAYTGTTDLRAPNGVTGTLLLDPYNVIISNGTQTTDASFNVSANDSVINATTLSGALATASVTITTGAGGSQAGNITVAAPISWSSGSLLTLTAANAIAINANITVAGGGQLALNTATTSVNVQSAQPLLSFGGGANVTFASGQSGQALSINGNAYTLVRDMTALAGLNNQSGRYALTGDLDATTGSPRSAAVIHNFLGTLEGLGHTISNLTISASSSAPVGLIDNLSGTVRDIGMVGGAVNGGTNAAAGGLVGGNSGTITQAYATGTVSGKSGLGGLVGANDGSITQSYATGAVNAGANAQQVGGLVGANAGSITQSYATGAVNAGAFALGVGGLVGSNSGSITQVYATGAVTAAASANSVGGLVGQNFLGSIAQAYATGSVSAGSNAGNVGGLVGLNNGYSGTTTIAQAYAIGSVTVGSGASGVGELVGSNQNNASVTNSFYDAQTAGASLPGIGANSASGAVTGVTTAQLASLGTLTALGGAAVWGNAGNKTTPYLLNNLGPVILATDTANAPTAPTFFTPILTQAGLEAVNRNTSANYVLANNLDLTGTTYTASVIGNFSGTLDGLGNTISNLTVNAGSYTGLIGTMSSSGVVRNIGLVGGSVFGNFYVGGLVGVNNGGSITQVYSTAAVTGTSTVGGLVGYNAGNITQSYVTGAVGGQTFVGGLVGFQFNASLTQVYATGTVSGTNYVGGVVGSNNGGTVTLAYWDTQTSGQPITGVGNGSSTGVTGLTTAQLQSTLPSGFSNTVWGTGTGLYPYLTQFFPNGVQAVSGFAYSDAGLTGRANTNVTVLNNGASFGSVSTGANGYYYAFGAANTIANNANILAFTDNSATLTTSAGATLQTGFNLYGNAVTVPTSALLLSQAPTLSQAQTLVTNAAGGNASALAAISTATGQGFIATGSSFEINQAVTTANTLVVQTTASGAPITVSQPITVSNGGSLGLNAAGALTVNSNITVNGAGSVALAYDQNTTTPSPADLSFGLTGSGFTGGLTYLSSTGQPITSSANGTLSINGNPYTLIYSMPQLDGIDGMDSSLSQSGIVATGSGFGGRYALARNLDASAESYTDALISNANYGVFSGAFDGLGHTISNLTINSGNGVAGLFGSISGSVGNLGLLGGSIVGGSDTGALAGNGSGTISNAYSSASVTGNYGVGGLVGETQGSIIQSFATGAVTGTSNLVGGLAGGIGGQNASPAVTLSYATGVVTGLDGVGGLVGWVGSGTISQSYATGSVSGRDYVGGLIGQSGQTVIQRVYATGAVTGDNNLGGLVGHQFGGSVTSSYYDTQTTGRTSDGGGATGLTTAQLQSGQATGLGSAFTSSTGLYPYLVNFFPNGVQAVSGFAYTNAGATPLASGASGAVNVLVLGNATPFGTASTGANGYYYVFGAAGSIASGSSLVAYTQANNATGAKDAATYTVATADPNNAGVNVYGGWKLDRPASGITTLSALNAFETAAAGLSPAASFTLANRDIRIAAPSFALDTAISLTGTLALNSTGSVTQSSAIGASALSLTGAGGGFTLTNAGNAVATIAANTGSVAFADSVELATGSVTSTGNTTTAGVTTTGAVSLTTTGNLTLASGAAVSGASPVLSTGGAFINNAGASGIVASSGRFLVWSQDPANDSLGNLSYDFKQYNATFGTTAVAGSGNGLLYTLAPTAEISAQASFDRPYDGSLTTRTLTSAALYISSGGVTGDTVTAVTGATGTFGSKDVGNNIPVSIAGSSLVFADANGKPVYGYQINSAIAGNITPKLISVLLMGGTSVYGSPPTSPVLYADANDLVGGDTVVLTATFGGVSSNTPVGAFTLQATNISLVGITNYAVSNSGAAAQWIVTPRPLTITADAQSRAYGDANPALTYTIGGLGLVNGNTLTGALATTATTTSHVGTYGITQGTLAASANYSISYVGANLNVTPAPVVVTALGGTSVYGSSPANPGLSATGLRNGEGVGILTGLSNSFGITSTSTAAGSPYTLNVIGTLTNPNYTVTQRIAGQWIVTAVAVKPNLGGAASVVANDNFFPVALPDNATPIFGAAPVLTSLGTGTLYADPRFDSVFICFGGGFGAAQSCYAAGR